MTREEKRMAYKRGHTYHCFHVPTGEEWYVLGIDVIGNRVCAAGYPPTIGKLSDCKDFEVVSPITEEELQYRTKQFGTDWI